MLDGDGAPFPEVCVELWQASPPASDRFTGFGRAATDRNGEYRFLTLKPGPLPGRGNTQQAPHFALTILGRGLMHHLVTRAYFQGEALNATDPVLTAIEDVERRGTLIARPDGRGDLAAGHPPAGQPARAGDRDRVPGSVVGAAQRRQAHVTEIACSTAGRPTPASGRASGSVGDAHFHVQTGGGRHVHQAVEAKQLDLPAHEVGHAGLRHAEHLGGLALAQPSKELTLL